jgi:aspartyl-tRNA(Asn)/glutamyl-tRNA(Gln) amidotransferase subunit C
VSEPRSSSPADAIAAIDEPLVEHLAKLSSLSLTKEEVRALAKDLGAILGYVGELQAVDVSEVGADEDATASTSTLRDDVPHEGLTREEALRGAPRATETGFAVPGFATGARGHK